MWKLPPAGRGLVYHLPAVKRAIKNQDLVVVVEGEKDADRLTSLNLCATCNAGGASASGRMRSKWTPRHAAHLSGAARVVVSDPRGAARAAAAARADAVLDPGDPEAAARELGGDGASEVTFEAAGAEASFRWALQHTAPGGTVVQIGTLQQPFAAPLNTIMAHELRVVGSFRFAGAFRVGAALLATRRIEVESLITGVLPIAQTPAVLHRASSDAAAIKLHVSRR